MHEFITRGDLVKIKTLLEHGADVNIPDEDHWNRLPLFRAIELNEYEAVVLLVEHGADVNAQKSDGNAVMRTFDDRDTALMAAVREGNKRLIRFFVEHGADVNFKSELYDGSFETALTIAVGYDNLKIVRYLVEHGANVNPFFDQTWVPYWYELSKRIDSSPEIVRYLRSRDYIFNGGVAILLLLIVAILTIAMWMGYRRKPNEAN